MSTPATVEVWESNGVAETPTKITGLSFGSIDSPNLVAVDHPLVIPLAGAVYSFDKWTRWKVTAWVDTTTINNLKWFKSAGAGAPTGWAEGFNDSTGVAYATPSRNHPNYNHTAWPTTGLTAVAITGTVTNPTLGYINASTYAYMLVLIDNSAVAGAKGVHTITYRYDEA